MIDFNEEIFNQIADKLRNSFEDIYVIGTTVSYENKRFPAVSIAQESNIINTYYSTFDEIENVVKVTYYVEIYTKDKETNLAIAEMINDCFLNLGYARTYNRLLPNANDAIGRRIMRFKKNNITQGG